METSDLGFWLMIAFFCVAVGGLVTGINWASGRDRSQADHARSVKPLKKGQNAKEK